MQFVFDEFVLDIAARELRRSGTAVRLSPKVFELLQVLIERRPAAVSKADLHTLLWPDTFVTDTSLANLISELRIALGDDARRPRYIRTVHAYGYAFAGQAARSTSPVTLVGARYWIEWEGRRFPLADGENVIGRAPDSTIVIDYPEVSRRHARITLSPDGATIDDLGSRNGTFVREQRITLACQLRDGDRIGIGPVPMTFRAAPPDATTRAVASERPKN